MHKNKTLTPYHPTGVVVAHSLAVRPCQTSVNHIDLAANLTKLTNQVNTTSGLIERIAVMMSRRGSVSG